MTISYATRAVGMKVTRRRFSPKVYAEIVLRQKGRCACGCGEAFEVGVTPDFDHIRELWDGGEDTPENLQALKPHHHKAKTGKSTSRRAKLERIKERDGLRKPKLSARDRAIQKFAGLRE